MKTITRTIVAGPTISLLVITDPVLALPNFNAPLNGLGVPGLAPIGPGQPPEPQPTPPTILQKTTNSIKFEWEDRFSNETGNILERRQPGGLWMFLKDLGPVYGVKSYEDSGLIHGAHYCYRVQVHGSFGRKFSPERCVSTNRMRLDGVPVVDDPLGLLGELKAEWDGKKLIYVDDNAVIDLTPYPNLKLPAGVTLASGRDKLKKGALLFTKNRDGALFTVTGSSVRITGLRIQGPQAQGIAKGNDREAEGIYIYVGKFDGPLDSRSKIEIDHNEIYGWDHAGVYVGDCTKEGEQEGTCAKRINAINADAVHIHDNFIHHNQHESSAGYGVVLAHGAYSLIERNVFDYNRHAIAADGREGTGYKAYDNFVLKHGGVHRSGHTHQFDMDGRDSCAFGIDWLADDDWDIYNCGLAGEFMDIRYNTFQYTANEAFKLRGTPKLFDTPGIEAGAYVVSNVFTHPCIFPSSPCSLLNPPPGAYALSQTESGLHQRDNLTGIDTSDELGEGDFDGDGIIDLFQATGVTWWYSSGGQAEWRYLNTSDLRLRDLFLSDFDGDGKTDVLRRSGNDWLVSCGGTGPWIKGDRLACRQPGPKAPGTFFAPTGISQK